MEKIKTVLSLAWIGIKDFMNTPITDPAFNDHLNTIVLVAVPIFIVVLIFLFYLLKKKSKENKTL